MSRYILELRNNFINKKKMRMSYEINYVYSKKGQVQLGFFSMYLTQKESIVAAKSEECDFCLTGNFK